MKNVVHGLYTQFQQMENCKFNNMFNRLSFSIPFDNGYAIHVAENTQSDVRFSIYSENDSYDYVLVDAINISHNDINLIPHLVEFVQLADKKEIQKDGILSVAERINLSDRIITNQEPELCR